MSIEDLIKQLNDMKLLYGDRIVLIITDGEYEYAVKGVTGKMCAQYFEPSDHVSEVIIALKRKRMRKYE